jgi:hypothetical protein
VRTHRAVVSGRHRVVPVPGGDLAGASAAIHRVVYAAWRAHTGGRHRVGWASSGEAPVGWFAVVTASERQPRPHTPRPNPELMRRASLTAEGDAVYTQILDQHSLYRRGSQTTPAAGTLGDL